MLRQSAGNAVADLAARADEPKLLCKSELLKIAHQQGQELRQAAQQRAEQTLEQHPQARERLLPTVAPPATEELTELAEEATTQPERRSNASSCRLTRP